MVGDAVGAEAAVRSIPGGDAVEGGQDERRGDRRVGLAERADGDSVLDRRPEAPLVGVAALGDGCAAVGREVAPLGDEDAGPLGIRR